MSFKIKDSNIFPMPGDKRFIHLATITSGLREFIVFVGTKGSVDGKCYIEEAVLVANPKTEDVTGCLKFIDDDNLANDLAAFVQEKNLLDIPSRMRQSPKLFTF